MRLSRIFFFRFFAFITVIALLTASESQSFAQEIGLEYGITQAGYEDALERPAGFGGHLDIPFLSNLGLNITERIGFRLAGSKHTQQKTIVRSRCFGLGFPGADCSPDTFDGNAHISRLGAGIVITFLEFIPRIQPEIYAMGISTNLESTFTGRESGNSIGPFNPTENAWGIEFGGALNYRISRFFNLYGRFAMQETNIEGCATDIWAPFCEERTFYQINFGAELRFSELFED